jgi:AraC-like DNA-binding protein
MLFRKYAPGPPLSDFIENFWLYDGYSRLHVRERIFPSGTFELVFNLRDDELRLYNETNSGGCGRYSGSLVSGPYNGFFVTDRAEEFSVMGVHFRPGGAFPFLGLSAYELADTHLDLATIWGRRAVEIRERLAFAPSARERFRLLENALRSRLNGPLEHHPAVSLALDGFRSDHSRALVRKLAREAGLSDRRFIDVFRSEVGLNPKLFTRIERFQRVLEEVHHLPEHEWEQLALEHGYFDQSHLIRDFLEFSGFSPADYLRRLKDLRDKGLHVKFNHLPVGK